MKNKINLFAMVFILMSICISCTKQTSIAENGFEIVNHGNEVGNLIIEGGTAKIEVKNASIIPDSLLSQYGVIKLPNEKKDGESIADFMLKQPGVKKDDVGNVILVSGKKVTSEDIKFIEKLQFNK